MLIIDIFFESHIKEKKLTIDIERKIKTKNRDVIPMICMKIYRQGKDILVSACDKHLIGKTFKQGKLQIVASKKFYGGDEIDANVLKKHLAEATIANLVGNEAVKCAVDLGLIDKSCILKINGVPHAQMVRMF